jgi:predicted MFS family arabinose efflux permease
MTATAQSEARRNILLLAVAQCLYSCCVITVFSTAGLVGLSIAPNPSLATAPITTFVLGALFTTVPASLLMQRLGRPTVFIAGAALCIVGAILAFWSIYTENFTTFCFATAFYGAFQATSGFYRFAAAETASDDTKSIAISWVLTGGVVAAVAGTIISSRTSELVAEHVFAGSYAATGLLALANIIVILRLRLPKPKASDIEGPQRSWAELFQQPKLIVAMASAIIAYGLMNLMMTAAPIAMVGCGFTKDDASWVIQWHVLAMFVPSFFTGQLIKRFSAPWITAIGMAILIASAIAALLGITFGHFAVALILLGLGWNFGFIGGTTMLTDCYRPSERGKVQALNDFGISALMAVASLSSGALLAEWGWGAVSMAIFPAASVALAMLAWLTLAKPRAA